MTNEKENPLGTAPLLPLIARFAIPSIISMLVTSVYNLTDQIFIGNTIGMLGNAATNVAFPAVIFSTGIGILLGLGTAANFNINQGAGKLDESKAFLTTGLATISLVGVTVGLLVFIFKNPILLLCGAERGSEVFDLSKTYISITAIGLPLMMFANSTSNLIRADGSPRYSMVLNVSGAVLNIFLDWLFMFPLGMGIKGAAIATVISQGFSAILAAYYFTKFKAFDIKLTELKLRYSYIGTIIITGLPNFCNHMLMMITTIVLNNVLTHYGALSIYGSDIPLAVSGVAAKINAIMVAFAVGTAQGCQPIWGFNLGRKDYSRVKGAYLRAFAIAFIIGIFFLTVMQLFPHQIISIFGDGSDIYFQFAERYLKVYMLLMALQNIQPVTINFFSGTGNPRQGLLVSMSRQGLFLIPLLLILPMAMGIDGILLANPISDLMSFIVAISLVYLTFRKWNN